VTPVEAVFVLTVLAVFFAFTGAARGLGRTGLVWTLPVVAWLALSAALSRGGWLGQFDARPPWFLVWLAMTALGTLALALSPFGARLAESLGWGSLIGFQVFRVPVEWVLVQLGRAGVAPPQMTLDGWNYDVVTGVTAPIVAWLAATGRTGPRGLALWNALGLVLLAIVVGTAMLSTPTPIRVFTNEPALTFVATPPWFLLPGFLVPAALFGHVVAFRKLRRMR
jgi:hypothetical protein